MILFGWGHTFTKIFGPTFKQNCSNCHNEEYWILTRVRVWFTLFFIPVFPYESKYFLGCPVCQHGLTLNSQQIHELKPLAEANQSLLDGRITKEEYGQQIAVINSKNESHNINIAPHHEDTKHTVSIAANAGFCSECGKSITSEAKFCDGCGTNISK
ncbi:MAG: zinc-ribbon domain-containing protein [Candidatus Pacebacteria bacterium]|nr:zinc-ribbon domain-containing protein [Candidatus Paceibacterota bacterium]